jgi:uncharacterized protein
MVVELRRFCEEAGVAEAVFSPSQLPRLLDSVADTAGEVSLLVVGGLDVHGRPELDIRIHGELHLLCQRCLLPMRVPLEIGETLCFGDDAGVEGPDPPMFDQDEKECLPMVRHIDLVELLEEEVLLSLPMLPRHAVCELPGPADSGKLSPFAALSGLAANKGMGPNEE